MSWAFRRRAALAINDGDERGRAVDVGIVAPSSDDNKPYKPKSVRGEALMTGIRRAAFLGAVVVCTYWSGGGSGGGGKPPWGRVIDSSRRSVTEVTRRGGAAARERARRGWNFEAAGGIDKDWEQMHNRHDGGFSNSDSAAVAPHDTASACPAGSRVPSADSAFLHSMFTRLTTDHKHSHLSPNVVSAGGPKSDDPPWILVFDDFLTKEEVKVMMDHLLSEQQQKKFGVSGLAGGAEKSNYNYRRSDSMSCDGQCLDEPWISTLVECTAEVIGLDNKRYAEGFTLTHYKKGGFYTRHHDYILEKTNPAGWKNCGNRILTFLVYLNDVEEGGATSFFHLGLDVEPKPGRALLFPNSFMDRPREKDERTAHEAKVVEAGEKYIAQTWFYIYDYQANNARRCC